MRYADRALFNSPYHYGLCLSEKRFRKELKRLKVPRENWPPFLASEHSAATTHFLVSNKGGRCAIVTLGKTKGKYNIQVAALLVHEAVHIWQAIVETIGEVSPSDEFMAYSIQGISQELMDAYIFLKGKTK